MRTRRRAGFTLIEMIVAITLVSAIVAGMLTALRGGLLTLERTQLRIQDSRGALGLDQMIRRQLGGVIPALGDCAMTESAVARTPVFRGNSEAMLLVTSYSIMEGARGYPRLAEYRVLPNNDGSLRLVVQEMLFPSPATSARYCSPPGLLRPMEGAPLGMALAPRLASARILYREVDPVTRIGGPWRADWTTSNLPYAIRIDLQLEAVSPENTVSITVPLHITRDYQEFYADRR